MAKAFVIPDIHLKPWILEEADRKISAAEQLAQQLFNPVLSGTATGHWNPRELRWGVNG